MSWLELSVIGNIILGIMIAILVQQRISFIKQCELRHNPIDKAIEEIKEDLKQMWAFLREKL